MLEFPGGADNGERPPSLGRIYQQKAARGRESGGVGAAVHGLLEAPAGQGAAPPLYSSLRPQMMLRNGRTALRELQSHENFLTKLNEELIETIQDMENSTTLNVRALLQQQDVLAVRPAPLSSVPAVPAASARPPSLPPRARAPSPALPCPLHMLLPPTGRRISSTSLPSPGLCKRTEMGVSSQRASTHWPGDFELTLPP